eukprot:980261-Pyramimonas_sp.AAC.1
MIRIWMPAATRARLVFEYGVPGTPQDLSMEVAPKTWRLSSRPRGLHVAAARHGDLSRNGDGRRRRRRRRNRRKRNSKFLEEGAGRERVP